MADADEITDIYRDRRSAERYVTWEEASTEVGHVLAALRSLPVEQRMTALGFVAVAERGHVSEDSGWWYGDEDHPLGGSVMDHQVLWTEAK